MIIVLGHGISPDKPPPRGLSGLRWEILAISALALAVRLVHLDALFSTDDYYHLLAAESWLRDGTLSIAGGAPYERASLFTYLVAGFMYVFGESSYVARLPVALAGAAWVTVLFVWLRSHAGRIAAWTAALLLCFDPSIIWLSRIVRFYTLHALVFLGVAIGVYQLATKAELRPRSVMVGLGIIAGLAVAYHLQVTTVIAVMALVVWLILDQAPEAIRTLRQAPGGRLAWTMGMGAGAVLLAGIAMIHSGLAAEYVRRFQSVPMWAAEYQDELGYYFRRLDRAYPVFVALSPIAGVLAIARFGRVAVFSVTLFCVPFLLHSLAAFKAERFLAYAMPFFFAVWGMAVAAAAPALLDVSEAAVARLLALRERSSWVVRLGAGLLLIVMVAAVAYSTPTYEETQELVQPGQTPPISWRSNWVEAQPLLAGPADSASIVVGTLGFSILYHLGRLDVVVGQDQVSANGGEFGEALQLGRPAIAEPESMEALIRCYPSGLVVVDWNLWETEWGANRELAAVVTARTEPIPLPSDWNIHAYRWEHEDPFEPQGDCPDLDLGEP